MITTKPLKERQLDQLYDWVDSLELSRPKKNISRDFSDATMMAEVIHHYFPKLIQLHNYPPTNSLKSKLANWNTIKDTVLSKLGITLTSEDCKRLSSSALGAIEALLFQFKNLAMENQKEKNDGRSNSNQIEFSKDQNKQKEDIVKKLQVTSKIQELREILSLLRQKISLVQRSIDRKDSHIRQLQEILMHYSN